MQNVESIVRSSHAEKFTSVDHLSFWFGMSKHGNHWKWERFGNETMIFDQMMYGIIYGRVFPSCLDYTQATLNIYQIVETQIMTTSNNATADGLICRADYEKGPENVIEGDPHIIQKLLKSEEKFCYDLIGKSGDVFTLIDDRASEATVMAELKDDYYFHKVILISGKDRIVISADYGVVGEKKMSWSAGDGMKLFKKGIAIAKKDSLFYVLLGVNDLYGIKIVRKQKDWGYYIDVLFDQRKGIQNINSLSGGLFGWVQSGDYEFNFPVQSHTEGKKLRGSIQVRGKLFDAFYIIGLDGKPCWSLPIDHILYPRNSNHFRL
ncbi:unnamed protein product [Dimorphilus gyrociliatus]|uniref:Uncharacterized protein n=1 Tax=Dimorphilus gyrociliatus TaxID=2664684 RepID=A0A7I8WD27_9ANNE|nr:unnamed protein product [Dimorphilus gyrociliatus]